MNASLAINETFPAAATGKVGIRRWLALWGAMFGAFMAVLDIQITNSSLPDILGSLTDNYGWPAIFYLNLVPGVLMLAAIRWGLDDEPRRLSLLRRDDWWGVGTMAVGLGSFIVFLEEGNRNDWFNSKTISALGITAAIFLTACTVIELKRREPFINLHLLARRNFGLGAVVSMAFGFGMYGATFLLPMYLAQVQGYNSQHIGWTIMWSGAPQLLMMPFAAVLLKRFDARLLLTIGLGFFGASCFVNSTMTQLTAYDQLKFAQLIRAVGMPLTIVPLTALATGGIEHEQSGSASALFNMLRNLGGSIGIALLATQLDLREKLHSVRLGEGASLFNPATQERLDALTRYFIGLGADSATAGRQSLAALAHTVRREAFVMSYGDGFFIVGVVISAMMLFAWLCRPVKGAAALAH